MNVWISRQCEKDTVFGCPLEFCVNFWYHIIVIITYLKCINTTNVEIKRQEACDYSVDTLFMSDIMQV